MSDPQHSRCTAFCSLLVYGSLMDRRELAETNLLGGPSAPVVVSGFSRDFGQEPSWRRGQGNQRGVLTVRQSTERVINAILVTNVSLDALTALDHRERGYLRQRIDVERLSAFESAPLCDAEGDVYCYFGRPERSNPALGPNPDYLDSCLEAAALWGDRFLRMFRQTTFASGRSLGS